MGTFFDQVCQAQALLQRPIDPAAFPETRAFEAALSEYFGAHDAIAVSSGTAALHCALAALGVGPGDEVLVPALAVVMSVVPVLYAGATPVFVDMEPGRIDFDYADLERKISPRAKAIMPVYLWGAAYTMPRLIETAARYGLAVIEDACQAHGSSWDNRYLGTWGQAGCFSLRDGKLLATGEGGFILTNQPEVARFCRAFRNHWATPQQPQQSYQHKGHNYRLAELLAWWGSQQLGVFDELLAARRHQTHFFLSCLEDVPEITVYQAAPEEYPNGFSPILLLDKQLANRGIASTLAKRGVANSVGTFGLRPVYEWPVFAPYAPTMNAQHTQQFLARMLAISLLPQYTNEDILRIIHIIKTTIEEESSR